MPAIQKIRKHGALLIGVIGLALFAFIAEEFFRSMETTSNAKKQQVAEFYEESINVQDFQQMLNDRLEACKVNPQLRMNMYGQSMSDDEIREQVWQEFVQYQLIKHEANKLGLSVSDAEVEQALRSGESRVLQTYLPFGANGRYEFTALQTFLEQYKKNKGKAQGAEFEQLETIHRLWEYAEVELRKELLMNKYNLLFGTTISTSNPVVAKHYWKQNNDSTQIVIATLPYESIADDKVQVTDADLKKAYEENKNLFARDRFSLPIVGDYRDVKYIDIKVTPNDKDRSALNERMQKYYTDLQNPEVPAGRVVATSNSKVAYIDGYVTLEYFQEFPDIANAVASQPVDSVSAPSIMEAGGVTTMNIVKVLGRKEVADSIEYQMIPVVAENLEKGKVRCDSIVKALSDGADFTALAKKLIPSQDSTVYNPQKFAAKDLNTIPEFSNAFYDNGLGVTSLEYNGNYFVVNIISKTGSTTVYKAAAVKCPLNFSNDTYNEAKNKLNIYLGKNKDIKSFEKNAQNAGYTVKTIYRLAHDVQNLQAVLPQSEDDLVYDSKDAVRWLFDEASEGQISRIYDCGAEKDHILVVALAKINEEGYLPLEDPYVKAQLTTLVKSQKKAAEAAKTLNGVKTIEEAVAKGAISNSLAVTFNDPSLEPKVAGIIAATKEGAVSAPICGTRGAYVVQVVKRTPSTAEYNESLAMGVASQINSGFMGNLIVDLAKKAKISDNRYKF